MWVVGIFVQSTDLFKAALYNNKRKSISSVSDDRGHNNTLLYNCTVTHGSCFIFLSLSSQYVRHQHGLFHFEGSVLSPLFLLVESSAEMLEPSENHRP